MASHIANLRHVGHLIRGTRGRYGAKDGPGAWEKSILGLCAEMAVARYTNLFWCGTVTDTKAPDVGDLIEVRSITNRDHSLLLHKEDRDDFPFVLVYNNPPNKFELLGWLFARDGKLKKYWQHNGDGDPCFYVPQDHPLLPMPALIDWLTDQPILPDRTNR